MEYRCSKTEKVTTRQSRSNINRFMPRQRRISLCASSQGWATECWTLGNETIFERARKLDAGDIHGTPEHIAQPDGDGEADQPANEEAKAILEVCLFAGELPDIRHDGVAQTMEDGAVDDVECKGDLA